tara:strand:+ start:259 stop:597 length:339 start_codon:yes stop_codon:yes gene_type:complete
MISVSKVALNQMKKLVANSKSDAIFLSLTSGGCNGFKYKLEPFFNKKDNLQKDDVTQVIDSTKIHICGKSLMFIIGTDIDYKTDFIGQRFTFDNPSMQAKCGCGTSFTFKDS